MLQFSVKSVNSFKYKRERHENRSCSEAVHGFEERSVGLRVRHHEVKLRESRAFVAGCTWRRSEETTEVTEEPNFQPFFRIYSFNFCASCLQLQMFAKILTPSLNIYDKVQWREARRCYTSSERLALFWLGGDAHVFNLFRFVLKVVGCLLVRPVLLAEI